MTINSRVVQREFIEQYISQQVCTEVIDHTYDYVEISVLKAMRKVIETFFTSRGWKVEAKEDATSKSESLSLLIYYNMVEGAIAPCAVPMADMRYVIRMQGQKLAIAAFAYYIDCTVMMKYLKQVTTGNKEPAIYEMVDNTTGGVLYTTAES